MTGQKHKNIGWEIRGKINQSKLIPWQRNYNYDDIKPTFYFFEWAIEERKLIKYHPPKKFLKASKHCDLSEPS